MPNLVTTRCEITGPEADIAAFRWLMIRPITDDNQSPPPPAAQPEAKSLPPGLADLRGIVRLDDVPPPAEPSTDDTPILTFNFEGVLPIPAVLKALANDGDTYLGLAALGHHDQSRYSSDPLTYEWVQKLGINTQDELKSWLERDRPHALRNAQAAIAAEKETGFQSVLEWCLACWGTKDNAGSVEVSTESADHIRLYFDTAWSFPEPVFYALQKRFPTLCFDVATHEESGQFGGLGQFGPGDNLTFELSEKADTAYAVVYGHPPEDDSECDGWSSDVAEPVVMAALPG